MDATYASTSATHLTQWIDFRAMPSEANASSDPSAAKLPETCTEDVWLEPFDEASLKSHASKAFLHVYIYIYLCVCAPWNHRDPVGLFCFLMLFQQGRVALSSYHTQRSCGREWEGKLGQFPVPAVMITPIYGPLLVTRTRPFSWLRFAVESY